MSIYGYIFTAMCASILGPYALLEAAAWSRRRRAGKRTTECEAAL